MKFKIVFLLLVLSCDIAWAQCAAPVRIPVEKCLSVQCPEGNIPEVKEGIGRRKGAKVWDGYKSVCFSCDTEDNIPLNCTSVEEARKICPNRYISYGCGVYSVLKCSPGKIINTDEKTCLDPPEVEY